jgi:hypothetical protein
VTLGWVLTAFLVQVLVVVIDAEVMVVVVVVRVMWEFSTEK